MIDRRLLARWILTLTPLAAGAQDGWPLFRGNPARTGAASALAALKTPIAWQRPLFLDKTEGFDDVDPDGLAKDLIEKLRKNTDPAILPGVHPIVVNDLCIYRSHLDVRCVTLQTQELKDDLGKIQAKIRPGEIMWKTLMSATSISFLTTHGRMRGSLEVTVELLKRDKQEHLLWANPLIGSFSSDGKEAYAVSDIVSPPLERFLERFPGSPAKALGEWKPLLLKNDLHAYDVLSGKRIWDIQTDSNSPLKNDFILGAPLPHADKLYLLSENLDPSIFFTKEPSPTPQEFRLVKLDPRKVSPDGNPQFERIVTLHKIPGKEQILYSPLRRTQPLHIAHADGLLVCPTHAGVLLGVDRDKMTVRWQYRYRDENTAPPTHPHWQAACPIILKDRIVFTAADAPEIHCIGLDGKKLWVAPAAQDLYLAAADNVVLLVGKTHCRALSLANGAEQWKLATGLPAGVGVLNGPVYYLPLKEAAGDAKPAIWAIDVVKGKQVGRVAMPPGDALGNLVLHRGMLVSQSVTHIAAWPLVVK